MLSKVLSKETCADCRFCCAFRRCSLWETPFFDREIVDKYSVRGIRFELSDEAVGCGRLDYTGKYHTDDENEEAPCEFLDVNRGCVLPDEDKPFDCKIWPLRIMNKDGKTVIALTPTCPAINRYPIEVMEDLVKDGLGKKIYEYAQAHPYIIKEYREGFPVLMSF
ncbi:MAG: hypothetical protein IJB96_05735 [Lachnospira sp.]|nr:hypothetical protein [Lachnospira sp.]